MANQLNREKSPYLLQHADNPVEWYGWNQKPFDRAAAEDKPIFLSIGYATCHWCHVMAHESFEDPEIARLMNETFINIKVDREERPDIDNTYMTICQMMTGQGGWPLTIIMTPDKLPFYAATYIPKSARFNRIGMRELVPRIGESWKKDREGILETAGRVQAGFRQTLDLPTGSTPGPEIIKEARRRLGQRFDPEHGGFGANPKFPSPHNLLFLLQYSQSYRDEKAEQMALITLEKMRLGGICDQIGFGFHRYSTDEKWLLPHFEKMLYDQAMLMLAYAEGWRQSGDPLFRETVLEIAAYVDEQLTSSEGGFFSAEDADSEGEEGKFYVWKTQEIEALLEPEDAALALDIYNFLEEGNFRDEATGEKMGNNIPWLQHRIEELAAGRNLAEEELKQRMERIRSLLKDERSGRVRPLLDDKVLTDWNGLMIAALSRAGLLLEDPSLIRMAERAWKFISKHLIDENGHLLHRYREGEAAVTGMADDYACLIWGLIELSQATLDIHYIEKAVELNAFFIEQFLDHERGGFYQTATGSEKILGRQKEIYDGAAPSFNSIAAMNLIRLSRLTGDTTLEEESDRLFQAFSAFLEESPDSATHALQALMMTQRPSAEIIVSGPPDDPEVRSLIRTVRQEMREPFVLLQKSGINAERLAEMAPYTTGYPAEESAALYLCRQFRCEAPVHTVEALRELLDATPAPGL